MPVCPWIERYSWGGANGEETTQSALHLIRLSVSFLHAFFTKESELPPLNILSLFLISFLSSGEMSHGDHYGRTGGNGGEKEGNEKRRQISEFFPCSVQAQSWLYYFSLYIEIYGLKPVSLFPQLKWPKLIHYC